MHKPKATGSEHLRKFVGHAILIESPKSVQNPIASAMQGPKPDRQPSRQYSIEGEVVGDTEGEDVVGKKVGLWVGSCMVGESDGEIVGWENVGIRVGDKVGA